MDFEKFARVEIHSDAQLWAWLDAHHTQTASIWLVTFKADDPSKYVSRAAVLDALIAYGWIDGRRLKLDDARTMQLISPRKQQVWAQTYKDRAARLIAMGGMQPAGLAAIAAAKNSGLWHASAPIDALIDPDDLVAALSHGGALHWWQGAAPSYRRNILRWIASAKRSETRSGRIDTVVSYAQKGAKVPQY
jgi:uncharacterized protein YdeI (YjbR/CyaY-like superfamily)